MLCSRICLAFHTHTQHFIHAQAALGISLLISVLRNWNESAGLPRRLAAALLYANFLYNRAGHFPGLKVLTDLIPTADNGPS